MILRTPRLVLRDFLPSDLAAYRAFREHPDFRRLRIESDLSPERSAELLHAFIAWAAETPRSRYQLAIEKPVDGLIGSCGVRMTVPDRADASFGCELAREQWGKGYGLEAGRAMIDFAFAQLGLNRVHAETRVQNRAALMLARKLGMRIEERQENTVTLAVLAAEWNGEG
jgi:RimJ/RimL family protein N-acetyltransferase